MEDAGASRSLGDPATEVLHRKERDAFRHEVACESGTRTARRPANLLQTELGERLGQQTTHPFAAVTNQRVRGSQSPANQSQNISKFTSEYT